MANASLHSVRNRMVSVFDAAAGRASGERAVHRQEPTATLTNTSSWHSTILRCHSEERSDEESGFLPNVRRAQIPRVASDDTIARVSDITRLISASINAWATMA